MLILSPAASFDRVKKFHPFYPQVCISPSKKLQIRSITRIRLAISWCFTAISAKALQMFTKKARTKSAVEKLERESICGVVGCHC